MTSIDLYNQYKRELDIVHSNLRFHASSYVNLYNYEFVFYYKTREVIIKFSQINLKYELRINNSFINYFDGFESIYEEVKKNLN